MIVSRLDLGLSSSGNLLFVVFLKNADLWRLFFSNYYHLFSSNCILPIVNFRFFIQLYSWIGVLSVLPFISFPPNHGSAWVQRIVLKWTFKFFAILVPSTWSVQTLLTFQTSTHGSPQLTDWSTDANFLNLCWYKHCCHCSINNSTMHSQQMLLKNAIQVFFELPNIWPQHSKMNSKSFEWGSPSLARYPR